MTDDRYPQEPLEKQEEEAVEIGPEGTMPSLAARMALGQRAGGLVVPLVTTLLAFAIGGLVVLATGHNPFTTYKAIFNGTGLNWFFPWVTGLARANAAINLQQTLIITTPLILTGLAVAFAFRCGMFNIGGQGQYLVGAYMSVWIGSRFVGMAGWLHILLVIAFAMLAGGAWAGIAGFLKATTGAHEVISTIMLNWIALLGRHVSLRARRAAPEPDAEVRPDLARRRAEGEAPGVLGQSAAPGSPHRPLHRDRDALRLLHHPQPDDARLPGARGRATTRRRPTTAASTCRGTTSWRWRSPGCSPGWRARSTCSAGRSGSRSPTSRPRRSASSGSPWRCSAATPRSGTFFAALLFGALYTGTSTRHLDPSIFRPDLAGNLAQIIQGLVVLFVGADVLVLYIWNARRKLRRKRAEAVAAPAAEAGA